MNTSIRTVQMHVITLAPQWRTIHGCINGIGQASLLGRITVAAPQGFKVSAFDACMRGLLPAGQPPAALGDDAEALLRCLIHWVGELQRHARLAIDQGAQVWPEALPVGDAAGLAAAVSAQDFEVAIPFRAQAAAVAALKFVVMVANASLAPDTPAAVWAEHLSRALGQLQSEVQPHAEPGFNQQHLLQSAYRLGVAVTYLGGRMWRLGSGARARLMQSTVSDATPALALAMAQDKWLTARVLRGVGLPATRNLLVKSADAAVAAALELGYPVVVKPADQDQGRGVAANLVNEPSVRAAFDAAMAFSSRILVEKHVAGFGHRFTVSDGEVIAVLKRIPGGVQGDGRHSVAELLALQLLRPEVQRSLKLGRVELDAQALELLADRGMGPHSVPAAGEFVLLRRRDNISAGGRIEHLDVAQVHPDNLRLALRAVKALYLDLGGVDLLCPDVTRSWREVGGAICEVNARPQFGPGAGGDSYDRVLARLLGTNGRIPVHLWLCGSQSDSALPGQLRRLAAGLGASAVCCQAGVWVGDELLAQGFSSGLAAARAALASREVESVLMALTPVEIARQGLPVQHIASVHVQADAAWPEDARRERERALRWSGCPADQIHFESPAR